MAKIISLLTALALNVTSCPFFWVPTLEIDASDISVSGRVSVGVKGIALEKQDYVVGAMPNTEFNTCCF